MKQHVELNGKTILVTGSPGFIGANLVLRLLKDMTSGAVISLDKMNDYYELIKNTIYSLDLEQMRTEEIYKNVFQKTARIKAHNLPSQRGLR